MSDELSLPPFPGDDIPELPGQTSPVQSDPTTQPQRDGLRDEAEWNLPDLPQSGPDSIQLPPLPVPPVTSPEAAELTLPSPFTPASTKSEDTLLPSSEPAPDSPLELPERGELTPPSQSIPDSASVFHVSRDSLPESDTPVARAQRPLPGFQGPGATYLPPTPSERPGDTKEVPSWPIPEPVREEDHEGLFPESQPQRDGVGLERLVTSMNTVVARLDTLIAALKPQPAVPTGPIVAGDTWSWSSQGGEGYSAASPSVRVSNRAGLRGAGGWGYGSMSDTTNFLEPSLRRRL